MRTWWLSFLICTLIAQAHAFSQVSKLEKPFVGQDAFTMAFFDVEDHRKHKTLDRLGKKLALFSAIEARRNKDKENPIGHIYVSAIGILYSEQRLSDKDLEQIADAMVEEIEDPKLKIVLRDQLLTDFKSIKKKSEEKKD